jgi:hypothetical protein
MPTFYNPSNAQQEYYSPSQIQAGHFPVELWDNVQNHTYLNLDFKPEQAAMKAQPKAVKTKVAPVQKDMAPLKIREPFTLGADPEFFIKDPDGNVVAADMIPGTKEQPHAVKFGAVQRDGFAAEYNIDPASTFEDWNRNHKAVIGQLQDMLPKGFTLCTNPSAEIPKDVYDKADESIKALGCKPDWNAWSEALNNPPVPKPERMRCIGGHVHVGWDAKANAQDMQHMMNCFDLCKQLDWFLGAWSVKHDKDPTRRQLYGKAGSCRLKPYGMEYRVLSSFWVMEKALRLQVWNRCVMAINYMNKQFFPDTAGHSYNELIISSINQGKLASALRGYAFPIVNIETMVGLEA